MTYAAVRQGLRCCTLFIQVQESLGEHTASVLKSLGSTAPIPFPEKANRTQITLLSIIELTQISHHWWEGQRRAARIELRMVVTDNKEPKRAIGQMIPFIPSFCLPRGLRWDFDRPKLILMARRKKLSLRLEGHYNHDHE